MNLSLQLVIRFVLKGERGTDRSWVNEGGDLDLESGETGNLGGEAEERGKWRA